MKTLSLIMIYKAEDQKVQIGFQNDTQNKFELDGEITFNGPDPIRLKGTLPPQARAVMGEIPFDQINDYPHFEMELERHSSKGHVETIECKVKPKPKHFIKLSIMESWDNRPGRSYLVWKKSTTGDGLENISIPKKRSRPSQPVKKSGVIRDLSELAVFNRELDLHADKLFENGKSVPPDQIYQKQMKTFQWYMDKARSMNIDRVFIIHGVGSGRLKKAIANKLEFDPTVASYANEHHPKYGFGATEVVFRN